jgi:indolepyruvate ferredoxin oxidoreductase alpha subunit
VLIVMNNGYSSATGLQDIPSSAPDKDGRGNGLEIESTLRSLGVSWVKRQRTYGVEGMMDALRDALTSDEKGLKVVIADGECQLARQRRVKPAFAKLKNAGKRVERTRFWVDPDVCTGDHSCIRLSGCPSLTIKPNEDPLRPDPIAYVNNDCVGCGLCGEVAHAAQLCPSFAEIKVIENPNFLDRLRHRIASVLIRLMGGNRPAPMPAPAE